MVLYEDMLTAYRAQQDTSEHDEGITLDQTAG